MSYPKTFRTYIQRTVDYALQEVKNSPSILLEDVRVSALHALDYGLDYPECWSEAVDLLLTIVPKMELSGIRDAAWIKALRDGLTQSQFRQENWTTSILALHLGMTYRFISEFPKAIGVLEEAIEKARQIDDSVLTAQALNELAWVEQLQHRYAEATAHANEALALSDKNSIEHGMSLRVLGMIALQKKNLEEARELHQMALTIFRQNSDVRRSGWALQNVAAVLRNQNKYDEAILFFRQAADILLSIEDLYHWAVVKMNLGVAYLHSGLLEDAVSHLQDAESQAVINNDMLQLANTNNCLGLVYLELDNYIRAEQAFQNAISFFKKLADDAWRLNNLDGLGMVYLRQKRYAEALAIFENALAELPQIMGSVNYNYLYNSLNQHWQEAKSGLDSTDS